MGKCIFCNREDQEISKVLGICRSCILEKDWNIVYKHIKKMHEQVRVYEGLPPDPPKANKQDCLIKCNLCFNECILSENDRSFCGLRDVKKDKEGILPIPKKTSAYIHGYLDPNPTNCCNAWFCPAGTDSGYPKYSTHKGPEFGTYNYAAFLYGCTFNCLFCQNSSHKRISKNNLINADIIIKKILKNDKITCVCFFGGTPEAQLPFSIYLAEKLTKLIKEQQPERILRFCWEWNGSGNQELVKKCMEIAIETGGNIKFDLKSYNEKLHYALCGVSNKRTLENFKFLAEKYFGTREDMPEMSGCTLMVPGYVIKDEVELIAKFISEINDEIPYSLLVFHPDYMLSDLPYTSREQAFGCLDVAKSYLKKVNLGNSFLLGL
ncbi:MAG: radical SAM protein [Promethearchaeota archaeon]